MYQCGCLKVDCELVATPIRESPESRQPLGFGEARSGNDSDDPGSPTWRAFLAQVCDWEIWSLLFSRIVSMGSPVYAVGFLCVRH